MVTGVTWGHVGVTQHSRTHALPFKQTSRSNTSSPDPTHKISFFSRMGLHLVLPVAKFTWENVLTVSQVARWSLAESATGSKLQNQTAEAWTYMGPGGEAVPEGNRCWRWGTSQPPL